MGSQNVPVIETLNMILGIQIKTIGWKLEENLRHVKKIECMRIDYDKVRQA
ncbi:hypothetical protein HOLleu_00545 [Holothuria leucospilota]|uniref:Uncharacterized protein n=1 Tax=Holothuria leucospilota TaxID=206669 RepID=A0A9Q1CMW8_HOLLE|nr:hypothetical protein HOLleu_00545 [Holothuria leucospilota]